MNDRRTILLDLCVRGLALSGKFLLIFMIAKNLSSQDVGFYGLYTGTISIVLYFVGLDFYTYSTREILLDDNKKHFWNMIFNQFCFFIISYIIAAIAWPDILKFSGIEKFYILGFCILIFEHISQEIYRLLIVVGEISQANFQLFIRNGLWAYICSVGIFLHVIDILNILTFWSIFSFLSCIYGAFILIRKVPIKNATVNVDLKWIFQGVKISAFFFVGTLFLRSVSYFDKVLALKISDLSYVGIYVFYFGIGNAVQSVLDLMVIARIYPGFVKNIQNNNLKASRVDIKEFYKKIIINGGGLYILSIPACYIVVMLTGKTEYADLFLWYILIIVNNMLINLSMPYHYQLYAQRLDKLIVIINMISFLIFIISAGLGIKYFSHFGIMVILISILGNSTFTLLMKYFIARKKQGNMI